MRPYDLAFLILGGSQGLRERSLTSVAEVVVAHTDLPSLINASDLGEKGGRVQMAEASATRAEKNGSRGSLVSYLRSLAQSPENSPQLNSYR